jgi:hypothetical protein
MQHQASFFLYRLSTLPEGLVQYWVCCYGGAMNESSAMCIHQQQFQHNELHPAVVGIINIINFIQQQSGRDVQ